MNTDVYTRIVLTVIAVCLVWIAIGGPALIPRVDAQSSAQSVIIAGWKGEVDARNIYNLSTSPLPTSK